jgi:hypothetical protein
MHRIIVCALIAGSAMLPALPASAQATRTWVSQASGDDAFACSRTQPCRTFAGAIGKTAINGEINCIDAGGYGAVTITKSVTIDCTGTYGSILANAVTAGVIVNITASADDPHRSVRLRGLSINGTGVVGTVGTRTGLDGIRILQASSVFVEDTAINDFSQQGIKVAAGEAVNLALDNVTIRNTSGSGVTLSTAAGQVVAALNNVRIDGTPVGVSANGLVRADLRNLTLAHNTTGLRTMNADNIINVDNMMLSFSTTGAQSSAGNTIRIANSTITQNATGLFPNGGSIVSMSGNSLTGNTTDGNFTNTQPKL